MNAILDNRRSADTDGNGDTFDFWVVKRSFSMVTPICKMGLIIVLIHVFVVDPLFYAKGFWQSNQQYFYLAVWHITLAAFFTGILISARANSSHKQRMLILLALFVGCAFLFAWFGFISWFLIGDLSLFAIALLCLASIFSFPGPSRRIIYVSSALALTLAIFFTDPKGTFITTGVFVNVVVIVALAFIIDGFMMKTSRALFQEKCNVEFQRARADEVLYNALPMSIANELKQNKTVKAEKYQHMTVLFADIVGFTKFSSSVPPDAIIHILNQIFSEFDDLVDRHAVEKIKTIGDAYMVVGKEKAASIADLACEMLKAMATYNAMNGVNFQLRIGIHIGPTVAGVIGLKRFLYDVWGDAVNTASRMESLGTPGRIHVSDAFFQELRAKYQFEDRGAIEVKGKGQMRTYFLVGPLVTADQN